MPYSNQPTAIVVIEADTTMSAIDAADVSPCAVHAGRATASVTTISPAASWVELILQITETDVRKWTCHLDASIRIKSWESL
jgi:hypothetical protein